VTRLTVVFAPDSFKGSLTSVEVARALSDGWARARPGDRLLLSPLADGGEGTLVAIEAAGGWEWRETEATGPLGAPVRARWLLSDDGSRAAIEMATASGLSLVPAGQRDPVAATTFGTGELIRAALDAGVSSIVLGIGGSATTEGGWGTLEALGARAVDGRIELDGLDPRLGSVDLAVACDVTNPLLGQDGAAATYGPQKGASPSQVVELDALLETYADRLERAAGRTERHVPGAGAAGGLGFGLLAMQDRFRSFALRPGIDLVMEATDFAGKLAEADVVVTGEGRIDEQTAFGKTAQGVARRAAEAGVAVIAVGGGVTLEGIAALRPLGVVVVPVVEHPQTFEEAMTAGPDPVARCGERIAGLISLGEGPP
jgi:glycerate 2-kinase